MKGESVYTYYPDVSIIIVNWNTHDLLERCLTSIIENTYKVSYEVTAVDNNSTQKGFDEVKLKFSRYTNFVFIKNNKNIGGLADNQVLPSCRGRYVLLLGPDTIILPHAIDRMVVFLDRVNQAGAVTANLLNLDGTVQKYCLRFWDLSMVFFLLTAMGRLIDKLVLGDMLYRYYTYQNVDFNKVTIIEQPAGACLMLRRESVVTNYIVDEDFPFYFNDVDLCKRIYARGYKIFLVPSAKVIHLGSSAFNKAESSWKAREFRKSMLRYFEKYHKNKITLLKLILAIDDILKDIYHELPPHHKSKVRKWIEYYL